MTLFPNLKTCGRLSLLLVASSALVAQESGQIAGTVKTAAGKPIASARVTIKAAQMIQPRVVVTAADGTYRVPLLPVGDYTISAVADGYITASATLRVGIGGRYNQDFPLKSIDTKTAVVEVVASAATADKSDTKSASNFSGDQLESLPTDRAFYGAAGLAPGVVITNTGSVSVRGATTQSTIYTLNGASIGDDYQGQQYENRIVDDAIEDVQVIQSPLNARYGRTSGGIINVVSKSGGNDFTGSIRAYVNRDDWSAWKPYERTATEGRRNTYSNRQKDIFISGPIIKDRLWFAASAVLVPPATSTDNLLAGENPAIWSPWYFEPGDLNSIFGIPEVPMTYDFGRSVGVVSKRDTYQAKLTFAISQDHTLEYEHYTNKSTTANRNPYGLPIIMTLQSNSLTQVDTSSTNNYGYKGTFGSKVFVEARYTDAKSQALFPAPPLPHVRWNNYNSQLGVMFPYGFNTSPAPDIRDNRSAQINIKAFVEAAGTHELDLGYDYYQFRRGTSTTNGALNRRFYIGWATPGATANLDLPSTAGFGPVGNDPYGNSVGFFAMNYLDATNAVFGGGYTSTNNIAPSYRQYYGVDGQTTNGNSSIYLNDQWTVNSHWNVMGGLRLDRMKVGNTDGSTIIDRTAPVSPRLMLRYDINGDSTRLITFTAAKYVDDIRAGFTDAFVNKANTRYATFGWSAFNTNDYGYVSYNALVNPANYGGPKGYGAVAGAPYSVFDAQNAILNARNVKNPYTNELTLGYRRTYSNGSSISVTAIHKEFKNQFAISQDADPSYYVAIKDPSGIDPTPIATLATRYGNSDLLTRRYNAMEMQFLGRLSSVWTVMGSYTYSRLTGNTEGGDSTSQGFRDNSINGALYMRNWLLAPSSGFVGGAYKTSEFAADGPLTSDRTHKLRVSTIARVPLGKGFVSYSFIANYDSGQPYSATASQSTQAGLIPGPRPGLPSTFTVFYDGRGAFRYNDSHSVDFKLAYDTPIALGLRLIGDFSVYNMFNQITQYAWNTGYTSSTLSRTAPIAVASRSTFGTDSGQYSNYFGRRSFSASLGLRF